VLRQLLAAWAARGRRDEADLALAQLLAAGGLPDAATCRALLNVHASAGAYLSL
jgi:hypothetical protein